MMTHFMVVPVNDADVYVPVPFRCTVRGMKCAAATNTVQTNDTIVLSNGANTVCTWTAVSSDGLVAEDGALDATHGFDVFDPESSTVTNKVLKLAPTGSPGMVIVVIELDPYVTLIETPALA